MMQHCNGTTRRFVLRFVGLLTIVLLYLICFGHPNSGYLQDDNSASSSQLTCLHQVLNGELPLNLRELDVSQGSANLSVAYPHHWDAGQTSLWNEKIRFEDISKLHRAPCSVWEVGANTEARDTKVFMKMYPLCQYHAFEPIPQFAEQLRNNWAGEERIRIHNYGLGGQTVTTKIHEDEIRGQSTFIQTQDGADGGRGQIEIQVKSLTETIHDIGLPTMLHLNCEGCEWQLLEAALHDGYLQKISVVQIGWHNYGSHIGVRAWQLCDLRYRLGRTHRLVSGVAFGWDRWEKLT